jgi:flagellin-like hook-associated protein FlgL
MSSSLEFRPNHTRTAAAEPLGLSEPRALLGARLVEACADAGATDETATDESIATDANALFALHYHDGLALIAQERRALHAVRRLLEDLREHATRAAWPATKDEQRTIEQLALRGLVTELRALCASTRFRGVKLLAGQCSMVGIQDAPESGEFLVLGLRACTPDALGLATLDASTLAGAQLARSSVRDALELVDLAAEVVVSDLHELLGAQRAVR